MAAYLRRVTINAYWTIRGLDVDLSPAPGGPPFRHLILTGPNGSGKSSALQRVADAIHGDGVSGDPEILRWSEPPGPRAVVVFIRSNRRLSFRPVAGPAKLETAGSAAFISTARAWRRSFFNSSST